MCGSPGTAPGGLTDCKVAAGSVELLADEVEVLAELLITLPTLAPGGKTR